MWNGCVVMCMCVCDFVLMHMCVYVALMYTLTYVTTQPLKRTAYPMRNTIHLRAAATILVVVLRVLVVGSASRSRAMALSTATTLATTAAAPLATTAAAPPAAATAASPPATTAASPPATTAASPHAATAASTLAAITALHTGAVSSRAAAVRVERLGWQRSPRRDQPWRWRMLPRPRS